MQDNIDVFFALIADKLKELCVDSSDADWDGMAEALDASDFDTAVHGKLAFLVDDASPKADWSVMKGHLDDIDFDANMRKKLSSAVVVPSGEDWNTIEAKLNDLDMDAALREKLVAASVPVNMEDWSDFEEALDELSFDVALRDKLEAADIPAEEAGWALLASQLGADFDKVMANKLAGATVSGESQWPAMEDQLEAPTEALIVEKINNISYPYTRKAWRNFLPMLDAAMPTSVFPWRSLAAAALFLLLAGVAGMYISKGNLYGVDQESGVQRQETSTVPFSELPTPTTNAKSSPIESKTATQQAQPNMPQAQDIDATHIAQVPQHSESEADGKTSGDPANIHDRRIPGHQPQQKDSYVVVPEENTSIASGNTSPGQNDHSPSENFEDFRTPLDKEYRLPKVEAEAEAPDLAAALKPLTTVYFTEKDREKSFNGNIQIGWTHALFNSNTRLSDPGRPGYLSGIQLNIPLSTRLQLITGILYGNKAVSRQMLNRKDAPGLSSDGLAENPTLWESLLEADFTVIEIPIMLRYPLTPADQKLSLALQGGVSGLMIVDAHYHHFDPESPLNTGRTAGLPFAELEAEQEMQRGGTYWGNIRFAPVIGYRLSKRVVFEAAPYLQFGQQRVGSKQLKLHSAGGTASILIELGKKASN
jgi:hypothetical protein